MEWEQYSYCLHNCRMTTTRHVIAVTVSTCEHDYLVTEVTIIICCHEHLRLHDYRITLEGHPEKHGEKRNPVCQ